MNSIKQWFASKGGVAHVVASAFAFFMFAFAFDQQFHAWVMKVWGDFPDKTRDFLVMAAGLWALYKKWETERPSQPVGPAAKVLSVFNTPNIAPGVVTNGTLKIPTPIHPNQQ